MTPSAFAWLSTTGLSPPVNTMTLARGSMVRISLKTVMPSMSGMSISRIVRFGRSFLNIVMASLPRAASTTWRPSCLSMV